MPLKRSKAKKDELLFLKRKHRFVRQTIVDKIYGCIIGSALGDTIGLYTEFLTKVDRARIYSDRKFQLVEPVTELYPDNHRTRFATCAWTDDTDQALLTFLSYLYNYMNPPPGESKKDLLKPKDFAKLDLDTDFAYRLKIWVDQGLLTLNRHMCGLGQLVGSAVKNKFYSSDPKDFAGRAWAKSCYVSAPNGSLMRTHPIGVIGVGISEKATWELAVEVGFGTHVDPRCTVSCCIEVALIRGLLRGEILDEEDINKCVERSYAYTEGREDYFNPVDDDNDDGDLMQELIESRLERDELAKCTYAETLEDLELDSGGIGYVYKCLGSAILLLRLAMRRTSSEELGGPLAVETLFEELTVDLIMEGGDADTNAAAACALLGAYLGYACLPSHWTMGLAHRDWLTAKTCRLAIASGVITGTIEPENDESPHGPTGLMKPDELRKRDALLSKEREKKRVDMKARKRGLKRRKVKKHESEED